MLKKLASETAIYGGTTIMARLLNYALVPLHTGVFAPGSYGIVSEFYAYAAVLNVLFTYGMETAYFRFATREGGDETKSFNSAVSSLLTTSLLFSGILIAFSSSIAQALGYPDGQKYIVWFALLIGIDAIVAIPFARLRIQHKAKYFALAKLGNICINFGLNIFFLIFCKGVFEGKYLASLQPMISSFYDPELGLGYAFLANLLANAMLVPILLPVFRTLKYSLNMSQLKPMLIYGFPIIFSGLAFSINEVSDRVLLKYLLPADFYPDKENMDAVGIYSACYKLSMFITLAVQAFRFAAEPFFFAKAKDKDHKEAYSIVMNYFIIACCLMLVAVMANVDWLSRIFIRDKAYLVGLGVVPILLMANVFLGIYYNLAAWFKITDRTYFGAIISSIGALFTISFNFYLIPHIGYFGSAWATFTCYGSMMLLCYLLGRKYYPIPYRVLSGLFYLLLAGAMSWATTQLDFGSFFMNLLANNLLLLTFLAVVFLKERKKIMGFLRR
ncbi:polysaccharide biosynthesis C-terminal domain-containing protein [Flammeovirgaceae bacterium SG7u.111]|nr:polysaccharide biosynthesis C-terminal domain-containing protein [Flammeovirgaceae bacterium SG7u.132]WPO37465.1 polysaccharide biosynthesis C-terminal domain-containing protein [Flammeovirgaceae bacterium SG7u.111]